MNRRAVLLVAGAVAFGCGLSVTGSTDPGAADAGPPSSSSAPPAPAPTAPPAEGGLVEAGPPAAGLIEAAVACESPRACVPMPDGWTVVALAASRAAGSGGYAPGVPCPAGFGSPRIGFFAPRSTESTCTCGCGALLADPCKKGSLVLQTAKNPGSCNDATLLPSPDGNCHSLGSIGWGTVDSLQGRVLPTSTTCAATPVRPPLVDDGAMMLCDLTSDLGSCNGSGACIDPPSGVKVCLARAGDVPCPAVMDSKEVIVPESGIADGRVCSGICECRSNATTCTGKLELHSNADCTALSSSTALDDACNRIVQSGSSPAAYRVAPTPDTLACVATTPVLAMTGSVTTTSNLTVCCP